MQYGKDGNGQWSPCRAKPENYGKPPCYHSEHRSMSADDANKMNENAIAENHTVNGTASMLSKSPRSNSEATQRDQRIATTTHRAHSIATRPAPNGSPQDAVKVRAWLAPTNVAS